MSSAFKLSLGIVATAANVALAHVGALPLGAFDLLLGSAVVVWHLGPARVLLCGALFCTLAVAAIPRGGCSRGRAYGAAMKSDLKNLASQQEIFYADHYAYSASFADLAFVSSDGVTVRISASTAGWAAVATHAALESDQGCVIFYGDAPRSSIGDVTPTQAGEIACTE